LNFKWKLKEIAENNFLIPRLRSVNSQSTLVHPSKYSDAVLQVNVAEGHKQRVILESEGHLAAKSNEADAKYKTVFREAEAR
jgi:hypothetical protein